MISGRDSLEFSRYWYAELFCAVLVPVCMTSHSASAAAMHSVPVMPDWNVKTDFGLSGLSSDINKNCFHMCACSLAQADVFLKTYNLKHHSLLGKVYNSPSLAPRGTDPSEKQRPFVHIECLLSWKHSFQLKELLTGVTDKMDVALQVTCQGGEPLDWDISWDESKLKALKVFISANCLITGLVYVPTDMWVLDIHKGDEGSIPSLDLHDAMQLRTFSVTGVNSAVMPPLLLPKCILKTLSVINLGYNGMEDEEFVVPKCSANQVRTLNLEGNKLTSVPACVLEPSNFRLDYLSLANNRISELTQFYRRYKASTNPKISVINLSFNLIRTVEPLHYMGDVSVLDLSHNLIELVSPDAFNPLGALKVLYLSHNLLQRLSSQQFYQNTLLRNLDLSHNFLVEFPEQSLPPPPKTLTLDVRFNRLARPPFFKCADRPYPTLSLRLYSSGNPFNCDCRMFEFESCLKWLDSRLTGGFYKAKVFADLEQMTCSEPSKMKGVGLARISWQATCQETELCPPTCSCFMVSAGSMTINCSDSFSPDVRTSELITDTNVDGSPHLNGHPLRVLAQGAHIGSWAELHLDHLFRRSLAHSRANSLKEIRVLVINQAFVQTLGTYKVRRNQTQSLDVYDDWWQRSCQSTWVSLTTTNPTPSLWVPSVMYCHYQRDAELTQEPYDSWYSWISGFGFLIGIFILCVYVLNNCHSSMPSCDVLMFSCKDSEPWFSKTLRSGLAQRGTTAFHVTLSEWDDLTWCSLAAPWTQHRWPLVLMSSKCVCKGASCEKNQPKIAHFLRRKTNAIVVISLDHAVKENMSFHFESLSNIREYLNITDLDFWDKLGKILPLKFGAEVDNTNTNRASEFVPGIGSNWNSNLDKDNAFKATTEEGSSRFGDQVLSTPFLEAEPDGIDAEAADTGLKSLFQDYSSQRLTQAWLAEDASLANDLNNEQEDVVFENDEVLSVIDEDKDEEFDQEMVPTPEGDDTTPEGDDTTPEGDDTTPEGQLEMLAEEENLAAMGKNDTIEGHDLQEEAAMEEDEVVKDEHEAVKEEDGKAKEEDGEAKEEDGEAKEEDGEGKEEDGEGKEEEDDSYISGEDMEDEMEEEDELLIDSEDDIDENEERTRR